MLHSDLAARASVRHDSVESATRLPAIPKQTRVLFVTSEMGGYLKSGGLGEVSAALPRAMRRACDVRVLLPGYPSLRQRHPDLEIVARMPGTAALPPWSLGRCRTGDGLQLYVVLCDELFFREGSPYGRFGGSDYEDNDTRFARLSLAAAEIAAGEADPYWRPDVVHVNDWPGALTPGYLRWKGLDTPSILTIHNLAYQGLFDASRLEALGIPYQAFAIDGVEFHGKLSFLKAGIAFATRITTVSETYAHEITTPEHGCGLDVPLRERLQRGELTGILNGIDESWSMLGNCTDAFLERWKQENATAVRKLFGLSASRGPLFSIVSRLVHQKGIDLSLHVADEIVKSGGQLVVTGRGEPELEKAVENLSRKHPGQVAARIGFDDDEARRIFAGSDFLLMPSRFEPCGLSQMYAQKCASLPIAHRTGGLADTIEDGHSGFLFRKPEVGGFRRAVSRAMHTFRSHERIRRMRKTAMTKRFDWKISARLYSDLYSRAIVHS